MEMWDGPVADPAMEEFDDQEVMATAIQTDLIPRLAALGLDAEVTILTAMCNHCLIVSAHGRHRLQDVRQKLREAELEAVDHKNKLSEYMFSRTPPIAYVVLGIFIACAAFLIGYLPFK